MPNQNKPYAVVLGSLHLDYIMEIPYIPTKGETLSGDNLKIIPGGKGGNQAYYLALQGVPTIMLGMVGNDSMATPLINSLKEAGVNCNHIESKEGVASGMSIAMVTEDKDYSAVILSGANKLIDIAYINRKIDLLKKATVVVLQYEIPLDTILYTVKTLAATPCKIILNAAPAYKNPEIVKYIDILIVNEVEAEMLTNIEVNDTESAIIATKKLSTNIYGVITTLGGTGLVYTENGAEPIFVPAFKVDVVDSHGAGDSFVGALSAKITEGSTLKKSIHYATCVAALSVQNKGPKNPNVRQQDVETFIEAYYQFTSDLE